MMMMMTIFNKIHFLFQTYCHRVSI